MYGRHAHVALAVAAFLLMSGIARAGTLWLYEEAAPDMGVGGAGRQAAGLDASTATGNPAAMTRLDRSQVVGGFLGIYLDAKFDVKNATYGQNGGGNAGAFTPVPTLHYVHSVNPDFKLGLGVGSYFGLGVHYSNEWAGKYQVQSATLTTMAVNPTAGYRIADWLSIGGGISLVQGEISERVALNTIEPGDGRLKYDASDQGYGFNLGALFELTPQTRVGVTYVSQVNLNFKDEMRFKSIEGTLLEAALAAGMLDTRMKCNVNIPEQLSVGAYHAVSTNLALVGTLNWQNWSRFSKPELYNLGYSDTYHAGLGAYYRVLDNWLLMAGIGYDTSPTSSSSERTPLLPLTAAVRYAAGVQYDWSKDLSIGLAYTLVDGGSTKIDRQEGPARGDLEGRYDANISHAFNVSFVYRF